MNEIINYNLFPTPVWKTNILQELKQNNIGIEDIINKCLVTKVTKEGRTISNRGDKSYQSKDLNFNKSQDNTLLTLIKILNQIVQAIYTNTWEGNIEINNIWININGPKSLNIIHNHPRSVLSGCVYLIVAQNSGCLNIIRNEMDCFMYKIYGIEKNKTSQSVDNFNFLSQEMSFAPKVGEVFVFPSHILHEVKTNQSNEDRISMAFNCS